MANIKLWEKNKLDLDNPGASITITDATATDTGQDFVNFMRDRLNDTGWSTTGSNDAANTQIDVDLGDPYTLDTIVLVNMNFDSYTLQYHNGVSYVDFSTAINESGNTNTTKYHTFDEVSANLFRLIITGTQTADNDKVMSQFIFTKEVGQFNAQPNISQFRFNTERKTNKLLSGREHIVRKVGGLSVTMEFKPNKNQSDQDLLLDIYNTNEGRLFSFVGGDDSTHPFTVTGFRNQDIFLMAVTNDLDVAHVEGFFFHGNAMKVQLAEVL